ncbi:11-beta-hydroxysteroid dehydrogenase-like protein [Rhynchospora pubera]|uniref:11-beta-hydroxysteroid dehydrogenase-like protein n=1 Tax=Rhynchospora pubera TaxID=906938 RepID=A0AAV8HMD4_9POAL|nr:11-beta-hydroxysteroid dehydrogenase-like protein [Rhynchospora pubera]
MDIITTLMNLIGTPTLFMTLLFMLPPFYFFKLSISALSWLFPEDVTNKVVLITGASSGIGEQLAYEYAKRGAALSLVARREASLREVAERAREIGAPEVLVIPGDVSKQEDSRRVVEATVDHYGRLDHLVNNAGISKACAFEEVPDVTNLSPIVDVNFWGSAFPTHAAIPYLRRSRGKILVTASGSGWNPHPRMSVYSAANAAVINFFETLRIELGDVIGITIATPGWVESELTKGKIMSKHGDIEVDQETRDAQIGLMPVIYAENCAKAIVDAVCRGDRYLTIPTWFRVLYLWRVFAPEVPEWCYRMMYMTRPGQPATEALGKKMVDATGAKDVLYPSSLHTSEIKKD